MYLGWLGIDRFYLGYPAAGLLKMLSFGGFFVGYIADVIMIALQILEPSGSRTYQFDYLGPKAEYVEADDQTHLFYSN